ncbi:MAG: MauE/DoxX family redox-associated membrane protein [Acidimicrobiales bacterium]
MRALAGPLVAAAVLLGLGGAFELRRPAATVGALAALGLRASPPAVRLGAAAALVVAAGAVVTMGRAFALLVAAAYLAFAAFVAAALARRTPLATCGCFGREDTPATPTHLVVNLAAAGVGLAVGLRPGPRGWPAVHLGAGPIGVAVFAALVVVAVGLGYAALTDLPRLSAAAAGRTPPGAGERR